MTKKSFTDATKGLFNNVINFNGLIIANVGWHNNQWKLVRDHDFNLIKEREYAPLAEFHLREDLWQYIKKLSI